ncbi:zinc metalloprotease [Nonomuraea sp. WAC 01424]|uniref:zinc metalloprotease n=1 Tax=Nonomuraea sp. WAC 01424 TaxID=2203200 RepID=UPI000F7857C5|nr:zinc metalloprotease [Nonomuraea sp. WAC 01424]RSN14158.1 zinc metalloprotease [Nonomuraea sp. WAC 01424]
MARRASAVSLACLLAAGLVPPLRLDVARVSGCLPAAARLARAVPGATGARSPRPEDVAKVMGELKSRLRGVAVPVRITVPTRVILLTDGRRRVSDQAVRAQLDVLNTAYSGGYGGVDTGVRFKLESVSVKENASWFTDPVGAEKAMKTRLHQGGAQTLNLYIAQLSELMLGFAAYPYWYAGAPALAGVVIDWRTLPGGAMTNYNKGFTGVHEIGHWLGLFHTFENGCDVPGDGIADTAPEGGATEGCPESKDTCPGAASDPMHNYMDYTHDRCMSEFSQGQAERMHEMWAAYRRATDV